MPIVDHFQLKDMDGYPATGSIRKFELLNHRPPVPIIALSARVLPEFRDKAHLAGLSEYITKPINREELLQTILRLTKPDLLPRVGLS